MLIINFQKHIKIPQLKILDYSKISSDTILIKNILYQDAHRMLNLVFSGWESSLTTLNFPEKALDYCCFKTKIAENNLYSIKYSIMISSSNMGNCFQVNNEKDFINKLTEFRLLSCKQITLKEVITFFEEKLNILYSSAYKHKEKYNFIDNHAPEMKFLLFYKFWEYANKENKTVDDVLSYCFDIYNKAFDNIDNVKQNHELNCLIENGWNIRTEYYKNIVARKYEKDRR